MSKCAENCKKAGILVDLLGKQSWGVYEDMRRVIQLNDEDEYSLVTCKSLKDDAPLSLCFTHVASQITVRIEAGGEYKFEDTWRPAECALSPIHVMWIPSKDCNLDVVEEKEIEYRDLSKSKATLCYSIKPTGFKPTQMHVIKEGMLLFDENKEYAGFFLIPWADFRARSLPTMHRVIAPTAKIEKIATNNDRLVAVLSNRNVYVYCLGEHTKVGPDEYRLEMLQTVNIEDAEGEVIDIQFVYPKTATRVSCSSPSSPSSPSSSTSPFSGFDSYSVASALSWSILVTIQKRQDAKMGGLVLYEYTSDRDDPIAMEHWGEYMNGIRDDFQTCVHPSSRDAYMYSSCGEMRRIDVNFGKSDKPAKFCNQVSVQLLHNCDYFQRVDNLECVAFHHTQNVAFFHAKNGFGHDVLYMLDFRRPKTWQKKWLCPRGEIDLGENRWSDDNVEEVQSFAFSKHCPHNLFVLRKNGHVNVYNVTDRMQYLLKRDTESTAHMGVEDDYCAVPYGIIGKKMLKGPRINSLHDPDNICLNPYTPKDAVALFVDPTDNVPMALCIRNWDDDRDCEMWKDIETVDDERVQYPLYWYEMNEEMQHHDLICECGGSFPFTLYMVERPLQKPRNIVDVLGLEYKNYIVDEHMARVYKVNADKTIQYDHAFTSEFYTPDYNK